MRSEAALTHIDIAKPAVGVGTQRTSDIGHWVGTAWARAASRPYATVVVVALAVRVVVALIATYVPGNYLQGDEIQYVELGHAAAIGHLTAGMWDGYARSLFSTTAVFMVPITGLFKIFGTHPILAALWAAVWGVATAVLTLILARRHLPVRWALASSLVVALMPSQVFWSSLILRESMVWSCLVAIAIGCAVVSTTEAPWRLAGGLALSGVALLALSYLRGQVMVVAAWALLLAVSLFRPHRPLVVRGAALVFALVLPIPAGFGAFGSTLVHRASPQLGTVRVNSALGAHSAFVSVKPQASTAASASGPPAQASPTTKSSHGAGALAAASNPSPPTTLVDGNTPRPVLVNNRLGGDAKALVTGTIAYLLRPFPWDRSGDLSLKGAKVENLLWYPLYVLAAIGAWSRRRELRVVAFPVVMIGAAAAVDALTVGNLGTVFRHRAEILWAVSFLAAIGAMHTIGTTDRRRVRVAD